MNSEDLRKKINATFSSVKETVQIDYTEIITITEKDAKENEEQTDKKKEIDNFAKFDIKTVFSNKFDPTFQEVKQENILKLLDPEKKELQINQKIKIDEKEINCYISSIEVNRKLYGYFIIQAEKDFDKVGEQIISLLSQIVSIIEELIVITGEDKYRKELNNLREIQAKLFPKFENIDGFDIASAYLPADLMSGNFIDGIHLDESTYQITACDISGYDSASSFAGATIRTLVKSFSSKKYVPSAMIEVINQKLNIIIADIHSIISITMYQINVKTGNVKLSFYNNLTTLLYIKKSNKVVNLDDLKKGPSKPSSQDLKDISLPLASGDMLLYFSKGITDAASGDGKITYGANQLVIDFKEEVNSPSVEIIQSLTTNIYDFTDYAPVENDMILICLKKK